MHLSDAHEEDVADPLSGIQGSHLAQTDASQEGDEGAPYPHHSEGNGCNRRPGASQHLVDRCSLSHKSRGNIQVVDYHQVQLL